MSRLKVIGLSFALISSFAHANNLTLNSTVPDVTVEKYGELMIEADNIVYQPWHSSQLTGKVRVIQAIAGRSSAKEMNGPLVEAIKAANLPDETYQTTTIINQDDAIWGTGGFVKSSAEDSKKEFSWSSMVLDAEGTVKDGWHLNAKSSAIILLDKEGRIRFVKEGALSQEEIDLVMAQIQKLL